MRSTRRVYNNDDNERERERERERVRRGEPRSEVGRE